MEFKKKRIINLLLLMTIGMGVGYAIEPIIIDCILQPQTNNIAVVSTHISQIFIMRFMFAILVALIFISIPLSARIACDFSKKHNFALWNLIFSLVCVITVICIVLYYRHYFSLMSSVMSLSDFSSAINQGGETNVNTLNLSIDNLPYYRIPGICSGTLVITALIIKGLRKISNPVYYK